MSDATNPGIGSIRRINKEIKRDNSILWLNMKAKYDSKYFDKTAKDMTSYLRNTDPSGEGG